MISVSKILEVDKKLHKILSPTPLQKNKHLSNKYGCNVWLKREDLQEVRSYKIRGAYNKISSLSQAERQQGIICASAGNHAQGVAYSCAALGINGKIFMPTTTPKQKIDKVHSFGKNFVEIILVGDTYDDASAEAKAYGKANNLTYIHPFDDEVVIAGQATVGKEIYDQADEPIDYLFICIGGGGLASGIGSYFKQVSPNTQLIGAEPMGAASMKASIDAGKVVTLKNIDKFVDGASVATVGTRNFEICKDILNDIVPVPEGKICSVILNMYNEDAIVVEPAGALSIASLDFYADKIKGKNVVCIVSGGNNDITRMEDIKERAMLYEQLKHYFIIDFPRRAGSFKAFVNNVLGETDEISLIEYNSQKSSGDTCPALIGVEVKHKDDITQVIKNLNEVGLNYRLLNESPVLLNFLAK